MGSVPGVVRGGVVIPDSPLPEGAHVEIRLNETAGGPGSGATLTPSELRKLPRHERQAILAAAAALAEDDYKFDKELTGFEAFSEELDDTSDSDPA